MALTTSPARHLVRFLILLAGAVSVLLSGGTRPALAHNSYQDGSPRDGEVLLTSPATWTAVFTKPVPLASASGEIIDGSGIRKKLAAARHGDTDSTIVFDLPPGLSGNVTARWRLVGTDGHVISGRVSFSVQPQVTTQPTTTTPSLSSTTMPNGVVPRTTDPPQPIINDAGAVLEESTTVPEPVRATIRFANYLALILLGGVLFTEWFIARGTTSTVTGRRLVWVGAAGSAVTPLLSFFVLVNDVRAPGDSLGGALSTALSLTPGQMLLFRAGAAATAMWIMRTKEHRDVMNIHATTGAIAILAMYSVALAYGGHSRSLSAPWLGIPADTLHMIGVAVWLGGLASLVLVVIPSVGDDAAVTAFSRFGVAAERAVALIVVTGVIQTARLHGDVTSLVTSSHGLLLLTKVAGVLLMLRLAVRNRRLLASRGQHSAGRTARVKATLIRASLTELGIGGVTIGITAFLVASTPG